MTDVHKSQDGKYLIDCKEPFPLPYRDAIRKWLSENGMDGIVMTNGFILFEKEEEVTMTLFYLSENPLTGT